VPVDDTHTLHLWYSCYLPAPGAPPIEQDVVPVYDVPFRDGNGDFIVDYVDGGDIMTWVSQGAIADRTRELLSDTDSGVVMLRRLFLEQIEQVRAGHDPLGILRADDERGVIELPQEYEKYGDGTRFLADVIESSHVRYSPLREQIVQLLSAPAH
jgi:5,5'-dehydrodivanillate O-demethylase